MSASWICQTGSKMPYLRRSKAGLKELSTGLLFHMCTFSLILIRYSLNIVLLFEALLSGWVSILQAIKVFPAINLYGFLIVSIPHQIVVLNLLICW